MKLIIFEGLDGSGKTSLINALTKQLVKQNQEVITLQGLGSSTIGPAIRGLFLKNNHLKPLTRYLLSFANMTQIQAEMITPALPTKKIILIDRWLASNFAYQAYPHQIDPHYQLFNWFNQSFIRPSLTIYLPIDPQIGLQRKLKQPDHQLDVIESQPLAYFNQVDQGFSEFLRRQPCGPQFTLPSMTFTERVKTALLLINESGDLTNGNNN